MSVTMPATVALDEDGSVRFLDESGSALPEHMVAIAKKQAGDQIRAFLQGKCDEMSEEIDAIANLHRDTPNPGVAPKYVPLEFTAPPPESPTLRKPGLVEKLLKKRRERLELENARASQLHKEAVAAWETLRRTHTAEQQARRKLIEEGIYADLGAMEDYLEETLQDISWPRETDIGADVINEGRSVYLDVDLPEVEDMPETIYSLPQRGFKLSRKALSPTQRQKGYMSHVHSIIFRLAGETFAALPKCEEVLISGFSQRRDRSTGQENDEYLLAVHVKRHEWEGLDFSPSGLASLDVISALAQFNLRRSMSKTGVFKPIEPFDRGTP